MKQRITTKQLRELTKEQEKRLKGWWKPQEGDLFMGREGIETVVSLFEEDGKEWIHYGGGCSRGHILPLLSIGQMLEFLQ